MGYNGSNRKGYDVRYRGFPKSAKRSVDSMVFGRYGLLTGAAKLIDAGIKDLTATPSYSRSRSSGTYYVFRTSSGNAQKSLVNFDFQDVSDKAYAEIISDYFERREQYDEYLSRREKICDALKKKGRSLKVLSFFRIFFKRRINDVLSEIDVLSGSLEELDSQQIDTSFKLDNVSTSLDQRFINSFTELFQGTKVSFVKSSENTYSPNEIPTYCHYYEISRENVVVNHETGPLTNSQCCSIVLGDIVLYFYSSVLVLTNSSKQIAIINYDDITVSNREVSIVESEGFNTSGFYVGGHEYLHQRVKGGPDRRYSYNPSRPMICYRNIVIKHKGKILLNLLTNKDEPLKAFIDSFNLLRGGWYLMDAEHLSEEEFNTILEEAATLADIRKVCLNTLERVQYSFTPYVYQNSNQLENHICHFIFSDLYSVLIPEQKDERYERGMWALLYIATRVTNYYRGYDTYDQLYNLLSHAPKIITAINNKINYKVPEGRESITIDYLLAMGPEGYQKKYHTALEVLAKLMHP